MLVREVLRVMTLTVGGGLNAMAEFQRTFVDRHRLLTQDEFALCYALGRITPGTTIFALCTALGYFFRGWTGALVSLAAASIPSSLIAWGATAGLRGALGHPAIAGAIAGSIGLSFSAVFELVHPYVRRYRAALLLPGAGWLLAQFLAPIWVLLICGGIGWCWPRLGDEE